MLHEVEHLSQRLRIGDLIGVVDGYALKVGGDPPLADALADRGAFGFQLAVLVPIVERGTQRIGQPDADFGPTVLVGSGGIYAEALGDVSLRLAPLTAADAAAMLDELRGRALLDGARGQPPVDRQAVIAVLLYSQLPIIRNTYTAISNIDPALREAARGMGM